MADEENPSGQRNPPEYMPPSPWLVPPSKAPKMWQAATILIAGFILLFGGIFYNFYSILQGDSNFTLFIALLVVSTILLVVGAVMVARSYGSKRYMQLKEMYGNTAAGRIRRCPHCGRVIPPDSAVCPYCGTRLE